jgi:predicted DNA-binding transcriptional regulator AlpA
MPRAKDAVPSAMPRRLLTRSEAAAALAVSQGTLSRWAAERQGPPFVKLGTGDKAAVRYPADELEAFISARTKHPK